MLIRGLEFPEHLYYHAQHMIWIARAPDNVLTLGLTPLAAATAGEILLFIGKAVGWTIDRDRAVGNVETGKTVSAVRTPVAGVLVEVNSALALGAIRINSDPYGTWLVRLRPEDWERDSGKLLFGRDAAAALEAEMDNNGYEGDQQ